MKLGLAAGLSVIAVSASAAPLPRYGVFTFSDLCWEEQSGDAAGQRFTLTRSRHGDRLKFDYGNGPLEHAEIRSLSVVGDKLSASASTNDGDLVISASLADREALLSAYFDFQKDHRPGPAKLRRVKTGAKIPPCR